MKSVRRERPATADVVVLHWGTLAASSSRARKIVSFLGVDSVDIELSAAVLARAASLSDLVPRCTCVIVEAETLVNAAAVLPGRARELHRLTTDVATHVFVYGFRRTEAHDDVLRTLSSSSLRTVEPPQGPAKFHVADRYREWCGQFSGLAVGEVDAAVDNRFVRGPGGSDDGALVRAGDAPFVVHARIGESHVFLSACTDVADLDEKVGRDASALSWFSRLIPLMMVLRGALGDRVWHNQNPRACFIIDDPALTNDRYGFLEYRRLVDSMRQRRFTTTIAFIPWNYRRSNRDVASLFSSQDEVPTLCVHGCDHTWGEFAATDVELLRTKAETALERMEIHRRLSGVPFDAVMVFPQGLFSAEAIVALKDAGYLAAVNSDVVPATSSGSRRLRDLLDVAITSFYDFPLFGRRYPSETAEFAFDLFVGRPALAVEHHGYFRDGYAALEAFVERLKGLDERLEWSDLGTICSRACLTKVDADGDIHVRFYANRFLLTNNTTVTRKYALTRRQTTDVPAPSVTVDGREWAARREDGHLRFDLSLAPGQTADIGVWWRRADDGGSRGAKAEDSTLHRTKVLIRRHLSEFRDNYVDTSRVLSAIVASVRH